MGVSTEHEWLCPGFRSLLQSCSSTLRRLLIQLPHHGLANFAVHQLLELSPPSLTHLDICLGGDGASFLETFLSVLTIPITPDISLSVVLPYLTPIAITIENGRQLLTEKTANSIINMISSRSRKNLLGKVNTAGVSPLTTAFFDFKRLYEDELEESCRSFLQISRAAQLGF
ncbi:hypothetical protein L218DRAFT_665059 [Marasmius fiardii PR-910]|nr:hypothetical protein L218DRAFT_665059 [Marasmius fiardii PR-910]